MTRHFVWFIIHDVRNRLLRQMRRLRSPRYAIAALVGVLYFFFVFGGWLPADDAGTAMGGPWIAIGRIIGPLLLALLASWWWLWGGHRHGLILSPAEAELLLPAPLSRTQVVRFKILQAQPGILFSALLGALIMRGTGLPWPLRMLSLGIMLATLHLHQIAASLVHAAADEQGRRGIRRNIIAVVLFGLAFLTLAWSLLGAAADIRAAGLEHAEARLVALLNEPGPRWVLAPFRLVLAPILATSAGAWLLPFAGAAVVLAAHFIWVLRTDAAFEETAAAEGQRRAVAVSAARSGGLSRLAFTRRDRSRTVAKPWLPMRPSGRPAYALFWKNVLYVQRSLRSVRAPLLIIVIVAGLALSSDGASSGDLMRVIASFCIGAAVLMTALGPLAVRNDLRMDLKHIDQLRTYPVPSRDLIAAEVAAATLALTVPQLIILALGILLFVIAGSIGASAAVLLTAAALIVAPVINTISVLIQNALALLYPSWVRLGGHDTAGMEAVGQNMIVLIGTLLLLAMCAIPPLLAGALVGAPLAMLLGEGAVAAGVFVGVVVAAGEAALLVLWLAGLYDRTDPVTVGLLT